MGDVRLEQYEKLGPLDIKGFLANLASKSAQEASVTYLNAGRGNPNRVATEPREAFFLLGQFAITESERVLKALARRRHEPTRTPFRARAVAHRPRTLAS